MKQDILMPVPFWELVDKMNLSWGEKVDYLGVKLKQFLQVTGKEVQLPVEHSFEPGWYIRRMTIPAGSLFIGRRHKKGHACILLEGHAVYVSPKGKHLIEPPFRLDTPLGYQAVVYAITDILGETRHENPTDSQDVEWLENEAFETEGEMTARGLGITARLQYQRMEPKALLELA